jgi:Nitronate monooxygenase
MLHAQGKFRRRHLLKLTGLGSAILTMPLGNRTEATPHQTTPDADDDTARHPRRHPLDTRLTEAYGVQYPFVGAVMDFVAMPPLVAAVSKAGGIGVLGAALEPPLGLQQLIQMIKGLNEAHMPSLVEHPTIRRFHETAATRPERATVVEPHGCANSVSTREPMLPVSSRSISQRSPSSARISYASSRPPRR